MTRRFGAVRLLAVALALLLYLPTFEAPFFFDDFSLLTEPSVTRADGWRDLIAPVRTRPLSYLTFRANYQLEAADPQTFHLTNILLFGLAVWIAGGVFGRLLPPWAAVSALAIFAFHPLQTEAIAYVYGRMSLLAGLFCLASWRLWLDGRRGWAVVLFGCALTSKEEAAAWPLFLLAFETLFRRRDVGRSWRALAVMAGLVVAAAAQSLYATSVLEGSAAGLASDAPSPLVYLWAQSRSVWIYFQLFIVPYGQNFDRNLKLAGPAEPAIWLSWITLAGVVVGLLLLLRRTPHAFWPLGALILLLPSSSIVPLADLAAERRMFVPMLSLAPAAGLFLAWAVQRRQALAAVVLGAGLAAATSLRLADWRSREALWRDVLEKSPDSVRARLQLSRALADHEPPATSERRRLLEEALARRPADPGVWTEFGIFELEQGAAAGAVRAFEAAIGASPTADPQLRANLGAALYNAGRRKEAEEALTAVLTGDPCNFDARNNLLLIRRAQQRRAEAAALARPPAACRFSGPQQEALERAGRLLKAR